jgi:antirestriction protein ArdC
MTNVSLWSTDADPYTRITANISATERGWPRLARHRRLANAQASRRKQHPASAQHRLRQVVALPICGVETVIVNDGNLAPNPRHIFASATYYKEFDVEPDAEDEDDNGKRRVARASFVFNASQVDGFELPAPPERLGPIERMESVDRFFAATGARVEHGGEQAFYSPAKDYIQMPEEGLFCGTDTMTRHEAYMAVLGHEAIHWTSHSSRLDRNLSKRFGKAERAAEELVAEIGAAFLCAELGITQDVRPDHAQYLSHWLALVKDDPKAIFTAAARASEAVNYLKKLQPGA